jgi:hypothetical protein
MTMPVNRIVKMPLSPMPSKNTKDMYELRKKAASSSVGCFLKFNILNSNETSNPYRVPATIDPKNILTNVRMGVYHCSCPPRLPNALNKAIATASFIAASPNTNI